MKPSEEVPGLGDKGLDDFVIQTSHSPMLRFEMQFNCVLAALISQWSSYIAC